MPTEVPLCFHLPCPTTAAMTHALDIIINPLSIFCRRESTITNLGAAETKLLYTLHWIILDAAEECVDADHERGSGGREGGGIAYHFSVATIQVTCS